MTHIFRIKSAVLKAEGHKFETIHAQRAAEKLAEVRLRDPQARLLTIPVQR